LASESDTVDDHQFPESRGVILLRRGLQGLLWLFCIFLIVNEKRDVRNVLAALAAITAVALVVREVGLRGITRAEWCFAGLLLTFLAANVLAMVLAPEIPGRGNFSYRNLHVTGVAVALAAGLGLRGGRAVWLLLLLLLSLAGLWYVAELASLPWRDAWMEGRLAGFRGHHGQLGFELAIAFCLYLGVLTAARRRRETVAATCGAVLVGVLLVLNNTRAALLTAGCVSVPLLILLQRRWGSWRVRVITACVWVFLCLPAAGRVWGRWTDPRRKTDVSMTGRMSAYRTVLKMSTREPLGRVLIGNGRSSRVFEAAVAHYGLPRDPEERQHLLHAHNVLLQTFVETGLVGVAILAGIWIVALRSAIAGRRAPPGELPDPSTVAIAVLVSAAAIGIVDYVLWKVPGNLIWLLTGMAFACGRNLRTDSPEDRSICSPMLEEGARGK
jgi:O-antigen ligase